MRRVCASLLGLEDRGRKDEALHGQARRARILSFTRPSQVVTDLLQLTGLDFHELDPDAGDYHLFPPSLLAADLCSDGSRIGEFMKAHPDKVPLLP